MSPYRTAEEIKVARRRYYETHRAEANARSKAYYAVHREKMLANSKAWKAAHPESVHERQAAYRPQQRNRYMKYTYGITQVDFDAMLKKQGGGCAICMTTVWKNRWNVPHIDHDHATGKVRGILCGHCNSALGLLGDSIPNAKRLIEYLRRANKQDCPTNDQGDKKVG